MGTEVQRDFQGRIESCFGQRAQPLSQFESLAPDAQKKAGWRFGSVDLPVDPKEGAWAQRVGGVAGILRFPQGRESPGRCTGGMGVDEENELSTREIQGMLDLKLEIGQQFYGARRPTKGFVQAAFQALQQEGTEGIVPPTGIAVAEDEDPGTHARSIFLCRRATSWSEASRTSSSRGILPRAWVAQERQGS